MSTKTKTVHSSRTMMLEELSNVMALVSEGVPVEEVLANNGAGKLTKYNQLKTNRYLRKLYNLESGSRLFRVFSWFWKQASPSDRPMMALLMALNFDQLLFESFEVVEGTRFGESARVEDFLALLDRLHPGDYSAVTQKSISKNLASSWKQAGYLLRNNNTRIETDPSYLVVALGLLLSYLDGDRGQFILESRWVKVLCLPDTKVRELAYEAARRDLLSFLSAGAVTTVSFQTLLKKIGIHDIKD